MGWACGAYGCGETCTMFWWGNLRERKLLGDPGADGRMILRMDLQEVGCGGLDWMKLAQDCDRWRTFVNEVMNLRVT